MLTPVPGQILPSQNSGECIYFDCSCGRKNVSIVWRHYSQRKAITCGKCGMMPISYWAETKFGKLKMKEPKEFFPNSNKKIEWVCDCGRIILRTPLSVITGNNQSCGKCLGVEIKSDRKFGKLRIKESITELKSSPRRVLWVCDCEREILIPVRRVLGGKIISCGRCANTIKILQNQKFGKLKTLESIITLPTSKNKIKCVCDCGMETSILIQNLTRGLSKSCGKCNLILADEINVTKFGKVKVINPIDMHRGSQKFVDCICDCGNKFRTKFCYLTIGDTKSCGKCNLILAEETKTKKFGKLKLKIPQDLMASSHKKAIWICDCGNEKLILIGNVIRGLSKSCGNCRDRILEWYVENENEIRKLETPIHSNDIPNGPFESLEVITNTGKPFRAKCPACLLEYKPIWDNFRLGRALTCGCTTNQTSTAQKEICNFIQSLGLEAILEYKPGRFKYDIFVSSRNLLIEYNGLKWHSYERSQKNDLEKYKIAISSGFDYLMIFEDEWKKEKNKVKDLIKNRLQLNCSKSIRPQKCYIRKLSSFESDLFYKLFHYIGACNAKIHYGVYFENELIAAISFNVPTRQSKHNWELVRMASNPNFRIHGIWSKLLKLFISEYKPTSIVSFSDNRLFQGEVYKLIGFKFDGDVRPDYYWVLDNNRYHKSGLRKSKEEKTSGFTEAELRESQGYTKIWDLGKKRWVLRIL